MLDLEYKVDLIFCGQWFQFQVQFSNSLLCSSNLCYACPTLKLIWDLAIGLYNSSKPVLLCLWFCFTHVQLKT